MPKQSYAKPIFVLFKKELASYFYSPIAYIFIGVFLIVGAWLFFGPFFLSNQTSLRQYFALLPWILLFLSPAITMRLWSEEKKQGTIEFLLTLPLTDTQAVLAKFLGALAFLLIALVLTLGLPFSVASLGNLDVGPVIGAYLGSILLGAVYLALGLAISGLTKNQIIAFVGSLSVGFILLIIGSSLVTATAPLWLAPWLQYIGVSQHFDNISRGVIDSRDGLYFLSLSGFLLWLNVQIIKTRK